MCVIVGSINTNWVSNPLDSISHRGPDYQDFINIKNVYLGHTRLSIQDLLSLGNQPMQSSDGRFTLVYNGEIYNYKQLWDELVKKGYHFKTDHSDTEVIVNGFREWGIDLFTKLNGMFGLTIWDKINNNLILARDRMGIKPLYYHLRKICILF